jgi:hypothetical protein
MGALKDTVVIKYRIFFIQMGGVKSYVY